MSRFYGRLVRSPGSASAALGVLLCAAIILLFLVDLQTRYWSKIADAKTNAQSFAKILAEHTALTFDEIDRSLAEAAVIRQQSRSGKYNGTVEVNTALRQLQKNSSLIVALGWTDASGALLAHSYNRTPPRGNISDMAHFTAHRDRADAGLFIAPPYPSAASDKWFTAASRRLNSPEGSFEGVVTAPIDQSYFTKLYRTIDLGVNGSVMLLHREGRILARVPENKAALGKSFSDAPVLTKYLPQSDAGAFETTSVVDGVERLAGYTSVPGLPLVLVVTYARNEVLKPWYRHLYTFGLLVVAIVSVILLGTLLLVRKSNALSANSSAEVKTNARFDAALSNMPHGLSMFDANERLLVANGRYREMYGLTAEQVKPGTPLRRILESFAEHSEGSDFKLDMFSQGAKERTPHVLRLAGGRIISIARTPMKDGGWVATHEDITEQQRIEAVLVANAAALRRANERFDVATSNMSQGLCLFDADKKLVISNRRYQQMYNLPDDLVAPGTPLTRILQHYVDRGETGTLSVEEYSDVIPTEYRQIYDLADGRKILIERQPLMDGSWVATHTDITEQKRTERLLAEKAAELERINVRFDAALNNMSQGLCMFDAEQRVVVSNAQYGAIYGLSPDQIKPGTSLRQILEYRREKGTEFSVAPDVYVSVNVKQANEVQELADGRVVAIARHPMKTGGWLTTHEDITERARNEKRIAYLAQHDLLTGLANRAVFNDKLEDAARRFQRHGTTFSVLMLDLDKFKQVNDTLGHPAGDQLLIEVASRLKSSLRDTDVLARLGGDEFAIIQENEKDQREGAIGLALRIIGLIGQPFTLHGHQAEIGTSIGISFAPEHGVDAEALLKKADLALYDAKASGRNDFRVFEAKLAEAAAVQSSMEAELREAISQEQFELHYQPIVDVDTWRVCGMEAFVRWRHPLRGLVAPDQFLPLAETTGLILPLGEWILQRACSDAAAWPPHVKIAINLSALQFRKEGLFDVILCALIDSGLSPERLDLEIADVAVLERDRVKHLQTIRQLKNIGISIVLDNCGAGLSSAGYLTSFPFDKVKIDKSLTQEFGSRRESSAVVASVLALARGLDIGVVAKGIETGEQFEALQAMGIDQVQGYHFGLPVLSSDIDFHIVIPPAKNVA